MDSLAAFWVWLEGLVPSWYACGMFVFGALYLLQAVVRDFKTLIKSVYHILVSTLLVPVLAAFLWPVALFVVAFDSFLDFQRFPFLRLFSLSREDGDGPES